MRSFFTSALGLGHLLPWVVGGGFLSTKGRLPWPGLLGFTLAGSETARKKIIRNLGIFRQLIEVKLFQRMIFFSPIQFFLPILKRETKFESSPAIEDGIFRLL